MAGPASIIFSHGGSISGFTVGTKGVASTLNLRLS